MRPGERRESGDQDLFRSRLDQIIDTEHALVKLAWTIDWGFLEAKSRAVYTDDPGRPPLQTRLMAGRPFSSTLMSCPTRCALRALGREPLLPILLRRGVLPAPAGVRSLVADALVQPHGRRAAGCVDPGKPVGGRPDQGDQAVRTVPSNHRHRGSAQERDVPHRCKAPESGAREAGAAGEAERGGFASVACAGVRPDPASALCPRQAVQAPTEC